MKKLSLFISALLFSVNVIAQTPPPLKQRSDEKFTQGDPYLAALKGLGIPSGATNTLTGVGTRVNLFYNTTEAKLKIYDGVTWKDASPADLTPYYTKVEVDALLNLKQDNLTFTNGVQKVGTTVSADSSVVRLNSNLIQSGSIKVDNILSAGFGTNKGFVIGGALQIYTDGDTQGSLATINNSVGGDIDLNAYYIKLNGAFGTKIANGLNLSTTPTSQPSPTQILTRDETTGEIKQTPFSGGGGGGNPAGANTEVQFNNSGSFGASEKLKFDGTKLTVIGKIENPGNSGSDYQLRAGTFLIQSTDLNNGFLTDNAFYNGSTWMRQNNGYVAGFQFYNGQIFFQGADSGSGSFSQKIRIKSDYKGGFYLGKDLSYLLDNIDGATFIHDENGNTKMSGLLINTGILEFADNAAALSAGLAVGTHYRTGDLLKIVH